MTRDQLVAYLALRAEECGYDESRLAVVRDALKDEDMPGLDRLRRISERDFRTWCLSAETKGTPE